MADTTLSERLPLTKHDDETLQQWADRLLRLRNANRTAFDRLEQAGIEMTYVHALSHAIMNTVENVHDFVKTGGSCESSNLALFTTQAINLLCLQMTQCDLAKEGAATAANAWPL